MKLCIKYLVIFLFKTQIVNGLHPHVGKNEYQIMNLYGYDYERHYVTTEDGYILEIAHILPGNTSSQASSETFPELKSKITGEPVLLMSGIFTSAHGYVCNDADKVLPFFLVNHGYDVYIGNARGTTRSRRHLSLDPDLDPQKFFDFSWHEMGLFDLPALIDHILTFSGFPQISYVGVSQGATSFFAMLARRPEYNAKIKMAFSLGGPGAMRFTPNALLRWLASYEQPINAFMNRLSIYECLQHSSMYTHLAKIMSDEQFGLRWITELILNTLQVFSTHNMNIDLLPVIASSGPAGASIKQLIHFLQIIKYGDFRHFDYHDETINIAKYGSKIPPRYNLSAITCPIILYYSAYDIIVQAKDTSLMAKQMQNATPVEIKAKNFCHTDYLLASNVVEILFKDLLWRLRNL